ncbi:hypothetical protein [Devosia sp. SD17-2]|jgi:hypothetical protein|uniref:hypothetical protein n=1 Tax=Devosia sp. SD17-2 TaxID=2976459 RepID=UPI0023D88B2A|nr:hypothetical protein [Devosia sp. SD17-2]WEJ33094.1 hypothetical protein NYQ88_19915 [Devosia sp. SD17-2]
MTRLPAPDQIHALANALTQPRQKIETAFVSVGGRLTEGASMLNKLIRLFESLPNALEGAEVDEATAQLRAVADKARALSESFAQEKADLARLVEVVAGAKSPIGDLRRAVKMMGIVSINARVTAAGIVGDSDDFEVFTTDIATLSSTASQTILEFSQVYRQLTAEVDKAASQRARFEQTHAHTLTALARSLEGTLEALGGQRQAAAAGSAETSRVSRQIVRRIGSAVMGLQVGDSTRQRLEHVEAALSGLGDILSGKAALSESERAEAVAAIAALEQAQLTGAAADFVDEVEGAEQALEALASDAGIIMERSRDLYGSDKGSSSAMAALNAQLRTASAILRDCENERAKLEAVATAVHDTVGVLLGHVAAVQDIEANMRLVSLNAAVRCAQLGPRGASLTVIATQLRELTSETVVAAEAAMTQLDQSSELAKAFGAAAAGDNAGQIGRLEQQANHALSLLTALDDRLAEALGSLNSDGPRVIQLLQAAASGLQGQAALAEVVQDIALQIAALSDSAPPVAPGAPLAEVLEGLRKAYTMEAERSIHATLWAAATPASRPVADAEVEFDMVDFML